MIVKARRLPTLGVLVFAVVSLAGFVSASPASAASPWWHLTSGSRPTDLQAGLAKAEVQEITVKGIEGQFVLSEPVASKKGELFNSKGEPEFAILPFNATERQVEEGLEGFYGAGNVKVTGGPGDATGSKPYVMTFTGKLADRRLEPIFTGFSTFFGFRGEVSVSEVSQGRPDGYIVVSASNLGDANANGEVVPVGIVDKLPAGLRAVSVEGTAGGVGPMSLGPVQCSLEPVVECTFGGVIPPYDQVEVVIGVVVEGASSGELSEASVSGGGAPGASVKRAIAVGGGSTPFGVEGYELVPEEEGGAVDTQAGSHPFQLTTTIALNGVLEEEGSMGLQPYPAALGKDLRFRLPPGLIGNPTPFPRCTLAQFLTAGHYESFGEDLCPPQTAIGVAKVTVYVPHSSVNGAENFTVPLFNLEPSVGEPARFGFYVASVPVFLDTAVRTGGDYGVTVTVANITQEAAFLGSEVTFWGVPGDARHDNARGYGCLEIARKQTFHPPCNALEANSPPPLLVLPTSCTGPLQTSVEADSWKQEGVFVSAPSSEALPALDGCNRLPFDPSIGVAPDGQAGSTASGLTVGVHVPQDLVLNPTGLAEANVKDTTVALPAGVGLNPAAADGLQSCSEAQVALNSAGASSCPDASKVGTVRIKTPLLPNPLEGAAYLAAQDANPFGSLVALYVVALDPVSGSLVKLAGEVVPDPVTGQLVSTFKNTPQLPFEDFELHFFGGSRAPLSTPGLCGSYTTVASIAPWSGNEPADANSTFNIVSGPNGSACSDPLPFDPALTAGTTSIQAGGFSPFTMTMSRPDGSQDLQAVELKMPPGLLGVVSSVVLCAEEQANAGTCGPGSLIGHTIVSVGVGGDPFSVTGGEVFLTGPYEGAPYGLSIVNPAKAGPFDLGKVVVRARIEVDPLTADLTVTTDTSGPHAIPHILDGIPLQIQHVNVLIDRPGFTFNPTDCEKLQVGGSLTSDQGATAALAVPFQVTNCAVLAFKPVFKVSTAGRTSRRNGASLAVKLSYPPGSFGRDANVKAVKVDLPKQLPSRLTTLQKACPDGTFNQNPASCPVGSRIGMATATTPVLTSGLSGPAYFVSHGGAKFPELVIVLSGSGVTVQLHGETFISPAGITSSTFRQVPDVPIGTFELKLPQGAGSALAANGNLCTARLKMPTTFTAQNGMVIKQSTPITATGCPKKKAKKASKHHKGQTHGKKR
jgi:hypothetical protein